MRFVVGAGTLVRPFSCTQLAQFGEVRLIRTGDAAAREELGHCCSTQTHGLQGMSWLGLWVMCVCVCVCVRVCACVCVCVCACACVWLYVRAQKLHRTVMRKWACRGGQWCLVQRHGWLMHGPGSPEASQYVYCRAQKLLSR